MKKLRVTIDGVTYDVEVEVLGDDEGPGVSYGYGATSSPSTIAPPPPSQPAPAARPAPAAAPPKAAPSGGESGTKTLTSPIAGVVRDIKAKAGASVKTNDPVIIIEAMKMETVVSSPVEGVIKEINVENGQSVQQGQVLVTFE